MIKKFFFVLILGFIFTFSACDKTMASGFQSNAIKEIFAVPRGKAVKAVGRQNLNMGVMADAARTAQTKAAKKMSGAGKQQIVTQAIQGTAGTLRMFSIIAGSTGGPENFDLAPALPGGPENFGLAPAFPGGQGELTNSRVKRSSTIEEVCNEARKLMPEIQEASQEQISRAVVNVLFEQQIPTKQAPVFFRTLFKELEKTNKKQGILAGWSRAKNKIFGEEKDKFRKLGELLESNRKGFETQISSGVFNELDSVSGFFQEKYPNIQGEREFRQTYFTKKMSYVIDVATEKFEARQDDFEMNESLVYYYAKALQPGQGSLPKYLPTFEQVRDVARRYSGPRQPLEAYSDMLELPDVRIMDLLKSESFPQFREDLLRTLQTVKSDLKRNEMEFNQLKTAIDQVSRYSQEFSRHGLEELEALEVVGSPNSYSTEKSAAKRELLATSLQLFNPGLIYDYDTEKAIGSEIGLFQRFINQECSRRIERSCKSSRTLNFYFNAALTEFNVKENAS